MKRVERVFEIVPRDEVPPRRVAGSVPSPLAVALEAGAVVFLPGVRYGTLGGLRARRAYLTARGYKVHERAGERDGVSGLFVWAEKNGAHP